MIQVSIIILGLTLKIVVLYATEITQATQMRILEEIGMIPTALTMVYPYADSHDP